MAVEEIKFRVAAEMDFGDAQNQIKNIRNGITGIVEDIADMPNVSRVLNSSLEKTGTIVDSIETRLGKLQDGSNLSDAQKEKIVTGANQDIDEFNVLRSLQTGDSEFSQGLARSWFSGLPGAVKREFDAITPQVTSVLRNRISDFSKHGKGIKAVTPAAFARQLENDSEIQNIVKQQGLSDEGKFQFDRYLAYMAANIVPTHRMSAYALKRYGSMPTFGNEGLDKGSPVDLLPASLRSSFKNGSYLKSQNEAIQGMVLSRESQKDLDALLGSNPIAVRAAVRSGISKRNDRGILQTSNYITPEEWEDFRQALYGELENRVGGGVQKVNPYSAELSDQRRIASRMVSSSAGQALSALHAIEKMQDSSAWTASAGGREWRINRNEAKRALDQYVVNRYNPFLTNGINEAEKVAISESLNTRLLGSGKWKNNQDVSDTVSLVRLAGYDPNNQEHVAALRKLYAEGFINENGVQMVAQSTHGKGNDTVIRMISKAERDRVNAEQAKWADELGLGGTYFGGFTEREFERRKSAPQGTQDALSATAWGKRLESLNKGWTPGADLGINFEGKKIALVDIGDAGDGAGYMPSSMIPASGQARFATAAKGSIFMFNAKNNAEFAQKTGLADEQGRWMVKGVGGQMLDLSQYDGWVPTSLIKNLDAYKNEDGSWKSAEEASRIVTRQLRENGLSYVKQYENEDIRSDNIGTQMSSFIAFSPEIRQHQMELAMKRMRELDTESGQLKYVFGNQDDWLSQQVNQDTRLLQTAMAQERVASAKRSLIQDMVSGKWIDFGETDSKFSNITAAANPLASYLESLGDGGEAQKKRVYAKARSALKKAGFTKEYTNQEIEDLILLKSGNAIDFAHEDQDELAILRSPTGYGNMLYARNRAKEARPIYEAFGLSTKAGVYASSEDQPVLQGFDYDADQFKVIHDPQMVKAIEDTLKTMHFEKRSINKQEVQYPEEALVSEVEQNVLRAGRQVTQQMQMGTGSAGIRIMQLDLNDPHNNPYIIGAQKMQAIYDAATTFDKKPEEVILDGEKYVWDTLRLGKEYTKFTDKAYTLFTFDPDQLDEKGDVIEGKDVFKASNGAYVNMRALRQMGVDNINLPSVNMANHMLAASFASQMYREGQMETGPWDAIADAMEQLDYGNAGPARKQLMSAMRQMLPQFASGKRAKLSTKEASALEEMIGAAEEELKASADAYYNPTTKKFEIDGRSYGQYFHPPSLSIS